MRPYYEHAGIQIFHGDCREVLPTLGFVDHVITDPPYARDVYFRISANRSLTRSNSHHSKTGRKIARLARLAVGDIGCIDEQLEAVALLIARLARRWAIVFSDVETISRWRGSLEAGGMRYVRTGAWVKSDPMPQMSGDRPSVGFEPCVICHSFGGLMRWNGGGRPAVWTYGVCKANRPNHPCPKPEPLMRELVQSFTDRGETILDPYAGSGTTLVEAKRLGRHAIGIEIEERYCEIAAKRLAQEVLPLEPCGGA